MTVRRYTYWEVSGGNTEDSESRECYWDEELGAVSHVWGTGESKCKCGERISRNPLPEKPKAGWFGKGLLNSREDEKTS